MRRGWLLVLSSISFARCAVVDDNESIQRRKHIAKIELWSRGEFLLDGADLDKLEEEVEWAPLRLGPVRKARWNKLHDLDDCLEFDCTGGVWSTLINMRGGGGSSVDYINRLQGKLTELEKKFGLEFTEAIKQNEREHAEDCAASCESFYCAGSGSSPSAWEEAPNTSIASYSFGATPPEDFADEFGFPLDLIKVTEGLPLFPADEAADVINAAELEGVDKNEYISGKYKLGGDWLVNLPNTRKWFNTRLESTFFPLLCYLFPEIVSSPSVLRAHSVSLLKYNASHPRTDVHVDNGILAMTLAMTPKDNYVGGGTFFEHMGIDNVLPMDVGHGTFRPGSVRHGGHKVEKGERYILGAFLLIEDRVEHVRRLKNRGSELRRAGNLNDAEKHFKWALAINPKCTTCLKDWAEILLTRKQYTEAEEKIREVLHLLEDLDSDALFTLGIILSEQGKDDESIEAYTKSVQLNADDAELCYNLGIKLGAKGDTKAEMSMYARATSIDPKFGGAWVNWGTVLAETGNLEDAEVMFLKAIECPEVASKALMNLALVYQNKANTLASQGDLPGAKIAIIDAGKCLDNAKTLLDHAVASGTGDSDSARYIAQYEPLRLQCHRLTGSILAGLKDFAGAEAEFKSATETFPHVKGAWEMLARVLDVQGKAEEANAARAKFASL